MLPLIITLFFVGCSYQTSHDPSAPHVIYFTERLENVIKIKCLNNANDTAYDEAIDGLHCFQNCWYLTLPDEKLASDEFYKTCMSNATIFMDCLENLVHQLESCLDPEENYLKEFIVSSYGNYNHYLCKFYGVKGLHKHNIDKCVDKFNDHPMTDPLTACYANSTIFGHNEHLGIITKEKLCTDVKNIQACYEKMFAAHCHDAPEFKELRMFLLDNALKNCNATSGHLNTKI